MSFSPVLDFVDNDQVYIYKKKMSDIPYVFDIFVSLDGQYVPFYLIFSGETISICLISRNLQPSPYVLIEYVSSGDRRSAFSCKRKKLIKKSFYLIQRPTIYVQYFCLSIPFISLDGRGRLGPSSSSGQTVRDRCSLYVSIILYFYNWPGFF